MLRSGSGEWRRNRDPDNFSVSLTTAVEGAMSEAWICEMLASIRDIARDSGMARLAEHMDDAMLVAASEFHESLTVGMNGIGYGHERSSAEDLREATRPAVH
jgi:hypothetical protein